MNKKWFLMFTSILLAAVVSVGCNVDPDPAPPEDANEETVPGDNENNTNNQDDATVPGVDENDTMNQDDEKDANRDPEDVIEDAKDMNDEDNKDE
ncbi:MAG: hypothetical protein ACQEWV_13735 [Bacillota bacterium]